MRWILVGLLLSACDGPSGRNDLSIPRAQIPTETIDSQPSPAVVPAIPPDDAREVAPLVYVSVMRAPRPGAPAIESDREFLFIETTYDVQGREQAISVPSTKWSLLSSSQKAPLAGMRSGEIRRIWRCKQQRAGPCQAEEVQVFDMSKRTP